MNQSLHTGTLDSLRDQFVRALREAPADKRWLTASVPVPGGGARSLLDLNLTDETVYFSSGRGSASQSENDLCDQAATYVGIGAAVSQRFEGEQRFLAAERLISDTFRAMDVAPDLERFVRFFGGGSFSPGRDGTGPCWAEFGDARFQLPRCTYVDEGDGLLICVSERHEIDATLRLADEVVRGLTSTPADADPDLHALSREESEAPETWESLVGAIQEEISQGTLLKVVAARRITLTLSGPPQSSHLLDRLNRLAPLCARFALRVGQKTFIGATPERLIQRRGLDISTEALAGSIDATELEASDVLLASGKNLNEHRFVVEAIREALSPLCESLSVPDVPTIRRLTSILHLRTPISGRLKTAEHILSLVGRLHPTPAVGGLPTQSAVDFISSHEKAERGWYAAPVGWVDARGDGEFVVALRSGLIAGNKVHLYAGAGIVADSDSAEEFQETELKLSGMLGALGLAS